MPRISSTSRDQAIFVDHAIGASLPLYAVLPEEDLCVPKTCATWAYAPQGAVGFVPRLAPGGQVPVWPGVR